MLGYLAIRRSGIYFAMITLALAQMVYFFCLEAPFTGGEDGIQQVPRGHLFGFIDLSNDMTMYWVVAAVFLGGFLLIHRIIHSPFGQVLKGDPRERAARDLAGLPHRRLQADRLRAVLHDAGVAGGTKALVFGIATLTDVHYSTSGEVVLTTLLGGLGTVFGPAMGARGGDLDGELPGAVRRLGDGDPGRDLHGLRAGVPPRDHRRVRGVAEAGAVRAARRKPPGQSSRAAAASVDSCSPVITRPTERKPRQDRAW